MELLVSWRGRQAQCGIRGVAHQDCRVIQYILGFRLLVLFLFLGYLDVLDIAASKDNIVELLLRSWDEVIGFTSFGPKGENIFEGDGRLFWIDLMESTAISAKVVRAVEASVDNVCT